MSAVTERKVQFVFDSEEGAISPQSQKARLILEGSNSATASAC